MSASLLPAQDEILQVLYWMRGERLGEQVSAEVMNRLLKLDPPVLTTALEQLVIRGLLQKEGDDQFRLTEAGTAEGARRFADEFKDMLGQESHLECSDPSCDCHSESWSGECTSSAPRR